MPAPTPAPLPAPQPTPGGEHRHPLEPVIGYRFRDIGLLDLALRHASLAESRLASNERLEFLGDAVLGLVTCELIYAKFPHLLEGEMTKIKSTVVSRQTCSELGGELNLNQHLAIGKGMRTHAVLPHSLAAAALEALIAAIYLDGGLDPARAFLAPMLNPRIERAADSGHQENFKSILQQFAQQDLSRTPTYCVLAQSGPDHAKNFQICVQIGDRRFGPAWGPSKKQAEQAAALLALQELKVVSTDDAGNYRVNLTVPSDNGAANHAKKSPKARGVGEPPTSTGKDTNTEHAA